MAATAVEAWDERSATPEGRADWLVPHPAVAALVPVLKARARSMRSTSVAASAGTHCSSPSTAVSSRRSTVAAGLDFARREAAARPPTEPAPGRCQCAALRRRELRLCVVVERHLSRYDGRCRPPSCRDLARPEARRALPGYDAVEARCAIRPRPASCPRHLHPRQRRQGAPALLLRLGRSCRYFAGFEPLSLAQEEQRRRGSWHWHILAERR
jgi:tellurite methyltransferase